MLLSISTTHHPATDLGFLLGKHPQRTQSHALPFGQAHVCFSSATDAECTAVLMVDVDPIGLVRDNRGDFSLGQYVNDRPYTASSFLSVAIARVFSSALQGESKSRGELAHTEIDLVAKIPVLYVDGGEPLIRALFEPLGYSLQVERLAHTAEMFSSQLSRYFSITLSAKCLLKNLMTHLYVLLPVLDHDKHYWVGEDEVQKLLQKAESWLSDHPMRDQIVERYLKHQRSLVRNALAELQSPEEAMAVERAARDTREEQLEERLTLNEQRIEKVVALLQEASATSVIDLGCGDAKVLRAIQKSVKTAQRLAGMDVSTRALEIAERKLDLARMSPKRRENLQLFQGSLTYADPRLAGYDAAIAIEVIEHLEPSRVAAFERTVFVSCAAPLILVSTPNAEYNVLFEGVKGGFRHSDHRFEWNRAEFAQWAERVAAQYGYTLTMEFVGEMDAQLGAPTQMAVFRR